MPHSINMDNLALCANQEIAYSYLLSQVESLSEVEIAELLVESIQENKANATLYIINFMKDKLHIRRIKRICSSIENRNTILNHAAVQGNHQILNFLLENGANPFYKGSEGKSTAAELYCNGHIDYLAHLIEDYGLIETNPNIHFILPNRYNFKNKFLVGRVVYTETSPINDHIVSIEEFAIFLNTISVNEKQLIQLHLEQFVAVATPDDSAIVEELTSYHHTLLDNLKENKLKLSQEDLQPQQLVSTPILRGFAKKVVAQGFEIEIDRKSTEIACLPTSTILAEGQLIANDVPKEELTDYTGHLYQLNWLNDQLSNMITALNPPQHIKFANHIRNKAVNINSFIICLFFTYNIFMVVIEIWGNVRRDPCGSGWCNRDYFTDSRIFSSSEEENVNHAWGIGGALFIILFIVNLLTYVVSNKAIKINEYNLTQTFLAEFQIGYREYYDKINALYPNLVPNLTDIQPQTVLLYTQQLVQLLIKQTKPSIGKVYRKLNEFGFLKGNAKSSNAIASEEITNENLSLLAEVEQPIPNI